MASKVEVCNMALRHVNATSEIANFDTEQSEEAEACRRFYAQALDATFRDFPWGFASKVITLALVQTDPTDEYKFAYRYPTDCVKFGKILSGIRNDTNDSKVVFEISGDDGGTLIFTNKENAQGKYTRRMTDAARYPSDFVIAFSYRLAGYIAPSVTRGDPTNLGAKAVQMFTFESSRAEASGGDEAQPDQPPEADSIRARE